MPPTWISLLQMISNGEPVDASVTNRPLGQLASRTDYLKAVIDLLGASRASIDLDAAVSPDVFEGAAVYWDPDRLRYDLAQVAFDMDGTAVYGSLANSAYVVGICAGKTHSTRGTIVLNGRIDDVTLAAGVEGGTVEPGPYFLSYTHPGKMTKVRPPVGILCMFAMEATGSDTGTAIVMPAPHELLENHIHYRVELSYGTILSPTAGWTSVFDSALAPSGAVYRYTVEADTPLSGLFPFQPPEAVYYEIDGVGALSKVVINNNGIWWMDTEHNPDAYGTHVIYYARMTAATNKSMVTSLRPWFPDGPLQITDCHGVPATAGDLYARLSLMLSGEADDAAGFLALKDLTDSGRFRRGPVVESIRSLSPEISVSFEGGNPENGVLHPDGRRAGRLVVTFNDPSNNVLTGFPVVTSLYNATQEDVNGVIPYIGLPPAYASKVIYRFDIPGAESGISGTFRFFFRAWVLAPVNGVLPDINVEHTLLPKAELGAVKNMSGITTGSGQMAGVPTGNRLGGDYAEVVYRPGPVAPIGIEVSPGDQLHIAVSRADAGSPSYAGKVGILRARFVMERT